MPMSDKYDETPERLWEKIEFHRSELDLEAVDLKKLFPFDQLAEKSPLIKELVNEVEEEFQYVMSEPQISWAVWRAIKGNMEEYNEFNNLTLKARK